jgi:hypothetical protein
LVGRVRPVVDALGWAEVTYSGLIISQLILILMQLGSLNSFELTVVKLIVMIIIILSKTVSSTKTTVFCDVASCNLETDRRFRDVYCDSTFLMMDAVNNFETLVIFY